MKKSGDRVLCVVFLILALGGAAARAATGVWVNATGGYWADAANWQDGVVPSSYGATLGAGDVADFTALDSGETITITNHTACGALVFPNVIDAVWTLEGSTMGLSNAPSFMDLRCGEIRVDGGTLNLATPVTSAGAGVAKTGAGALRLAATNTFFGQTWLMDGLLSMSDGAMLAYSPVVFASSAAKLALEGNAQVGGLESRCVPQPTVDLGGYTLTVGGENSTRVFGGKFTNGALVFARGDTQTFAGTQAVASVRLENGGLNLGVAVKVAGWWRFEDPAQVGKDSGVRANHLVQTGSQSQWLVNDAERGSVLALNGAGAYLSGPGGGNVAGLPVSNMPYTVAFWFKPAADVNSTAGIYAWGVQNNYRLNMMRLNTPSSTTPLMQTHYGNNRNITYAPGLMDGAWHHVAVVYNGRARLFYIDGEVVDGVTETTPMLVDAGNFVLGKGITTTTFKGLLDDVFVAQGALEYGQIAALKAGQIPAALAPENLLPETAQVEIAYNGNLRLVGDQTLASLSGAGATGGVELNDGAVLTVTGDGHLDASVTGDGRLVKSGSDTFTLGGRIGTTGAVEIAEGTLALADRLPPGLQAYYRFDDAANLGRDSSGNGYDLAVSNAPAYAPGLFNGAASFSAANKDHFYAAAFPAKLPVGNQSYTIAVWCNLQEGGNTLGLPVYWGLGSNLINNSALFRFDGSTKIMTSNMGNNWTVEAGYDLAVDTPDGGWHHIVCTYDGTTRERRVFINGIPAGGAWTNHVDLTIDGQVFWLGGAPYSTANYYDGLLDEVMIFDRALSDVEVSEVMTGIYAAPWGTRLTERIVARYDFEDAADLGKDTGPHGYHLAPVGNVAAADGKVGQALRLTSWSQGYLNWTNSVFPEALPTGNAPVTITAWVNPITNPNAEGSMVFWGTIVEGRRGCHLLRLARNANNAVVFRQVDGVGYIGADNVVNFDRGDRDEGWHHIAVVVGPGGLRSFYIDGARVAVNRVTGQTVDPGTFSIGYKPNAPTAWFQGMIDDMTIYDCALSRAEILETLRGRPDILPPDQAVNVTVGALLDAGNACQQVAGLTGAGELHVAYWGEFAVAESVAHFDGALTGAGAFAVRDGAVQTLAGAGTFSGTMAVSNATLLVENESGAVTAAGSAAVVQSGGRIGGRGTLGGDLVFENGGGIVAGTEPGALAVNGAVLLGATGTVALPPGFTGGKVVLLDAASVTAPDGLAGWGVEPQQAPSMAVTFNASGTQFTVNVFKRGTMIRVH